MKISELVHQLEPFINQMIEEYVNYNTNTIISGGSSSLPREHAIWLLDNGGAAIKDYSADSDGFDSANADASSGDIIWIPACTIAGDKSVTAGVKVVGASRYATIFSGQITLGASSALENLSVVRSVTSGGTCKGIVTGASGTAYLSDCDIKISNQDSGNAYGISVDGAGNIECWSCCIWGLAVSFEGVSGDGYAVYLGSTGVGFIYGGRCYGTTDPFSGADVYTSCVRLN